MPQVLEGVVRKEYHEGLFCWRLHVWGRVDSRGIGSGD